MREIIYRFQLPLFYCALTLCILISAIFPVRADESAIPVFVSSESGIYEEALAGLQSIARFKAEIHYIEVLQAENTDMSAWFSALTQAKPPFAIAFGLKAARFVREYKADIPLIFSMISGPKSLVADTDLVCGVGMDIPVAGFFSALKEIKPAARKVTAFYSDAGKETALEGLYQDLRHGLIYEAVRVASADDFPAALKKHGDTDAVLMVVDPLYTRENFEALSRFGREKKIVVMTPFASLVKAGATFGLTPDYSGIGVQTGEMANRLLDKSSTCRQELVKLPENDYFYLNEDYAAEQGLELSDGIRARAQVTPLLIAGVNLMRKDDLTDARKIFESILEKDPDNKAAALYLYVLLEKQTGSKSRVLFTQAETFMREHKYGLAHERYREALRLNPKSEKARKGMAEAARKQSEEFRAAAVNRVARGNIYEGIRGYMNALRVWPAHERARSELQMLRQREAQKIPGLLNKAIQTYNQRGYSEAILMFDNILLINPAHNQATVYLRLSRQKRDAADKLLHKQQPAGGGGDAK